MSKKVKLPPQKKPRKRKKKPSKEQIRLMKKVDEYNAHARDLGLPTINKGQLGRIGRKQGWGRARELVAEYMGTSADRVLKGRKWTDEQKQAMSRKMKEIWRIRKENKLRETIWNLDSGKFGYDDAKPSDAKESKRRKIRIDSQNKMHRDIWNLAKGSEFGYGDGDYGEDHAGAIDFVTASEFWPRVWRSLTTLYWADDEVLATPGFMGAFHTAQDIVRNALNEGYHGPSDTAEAVRLIIEIETAIAKARKTGDLDELIALLVEASYASD